MGKSERIRLRDVRAVYRLLGECCELGPDPLLWRTHMLERLSRILGAQIAICGTVIPSKNGSTWRLVPETFIDSGWAREGDRDLYLKWLQEAPPDFDPLLAYMADMVPRQRRSMVCRRRDFFRDGQWYQSALYNDFYRPTRLDDELQSFIWHPRSQLIDGLSFIRSVDAGPFAGRQWKLLRLFHREMCRFLGTKLAQSTGPSVAALSPRLRQVLTDLLEGDNEKQIATRLGISRHTVHEHVKRLHNYFGVSSRGELLSHCCRFLPALKKLNQSEEFVDSSAARAFGDAFRM